MKVKAHIFSIAIVSNDVTTIVELGNRVQVEDNGSTLETGIEFFFMKNGTPMIASTDGFDIAPHEVIGVTKDVTPKKNKGI